MKSNIAEAASGNSTSADRPSVTLSPFGSLVSGKIVIASNNTNYFAVEQHFFFDVMQSMVSQILFDEEFYLRTYPDVQAAIDTKTVPSANHHYARYGYFEHRLPYKIDVDESWYLENYKDVRDAIMRRHYVSAQEHFNLAGFREGRLPFPNFSIKLTNTGAKADSR
jgi:hypothetical protein